MLQSGIAKGRFQPGHDLKAQVVMLVVAKKACASRKLAVWCHPRAWGANEPTAAKQVGRIACVLGPGGGGQQKAEQRSRKCSITRCSPAGKPGSGGSVAG